MNRHGKSKMKKHCIRGVVAIVTFLQVVGIFFSSASGSEEKEKDSEKIVITAKEIEKMNVQNVPDLLNQIPGVNAGESSVSLRGSSMVRVILDGRVINDPTSGHRAVKWDIVSISNIEKIEIYKGSGGVEFGDDSSGGVIYITSKKIRGIQGKLETYGGNLGTGNCNLIYNQEMAPFAAGFSAGFKRTDGFRKNGDKEKKNAGVKFVYTPDENYEFSLSGDYYHENAGRSGLPDFPTPKARADYETFATLLIARLKSVKSKTYFTFVEKVNDNPDKNLHTLIRTKTYGENLTARIHAGKWGKINTGINFEFGQASGNKIDAKQEEKFSIFAIKDFRCNSIPVAWTLGLRGNFYSEFDKAINPEIKLKYEKNLYSVQFSVNKTNNTPTFLQRYNETSTTIPNPDLTMEKATNYSPMENLSLILNTKYVSRQFSRSDNTESVSEYVRADLRAEYGFTKVSRFFRT